MSKTPSGALPPAAAPPSLLLRPTCNRRDVGTDSTFSGSCHCAAPMPAGGCIGTVGPVAGGCRNAAPAPASGCIGTAGSAPTGRVGTTDTSSGCGAEAASTCVRLSCASVAGTCPCGVAPAGVARAAVASAAQPLCAWSAAAAAPAGVARAAVAPDAGAVAAVVAVASRKPPCGPAVAGAAPCASSGGSHKHFPAARLPGAPPALSSDAAPSLEKSASRLPAAPSALSSNAALSELPSVQPPAPAPAPAPAARAQRNPSKSAALVLSAPPPPPSLSLSRLSLRSALRSALSSLASAVRCGADRSRAAGNRGTAASAASAGPRTSGAPQSSGASHSSEAPQNSNTRQPWPSRRAAYASATSARSPAACCASWSRSMRANAASRSEASSRERTRDSRRCRLAARSALCRPKRMWVGDTPDGGGGEGEFVNYRHKLYPQQSSIPSASKARCFAFGVRFG
eukprot:363222-Chlamydomonas_euryale.AAC.3